MKDFREAKTWFPFFTNHPNEVYFDNSATTLKPQSVINAIVDYYAKYGTNPHNTDSDLAYQTAAKFQEVRVKVQQFINAPKVEEIVFTAGTTAGINQIAYGLKSIMQPGDEIFLTQQEHGANILPWYRLAKECQGKIKYLPEQNYQIDITALEKVIGPQTKIVTFANIPNILGYENDVQGIVKRIKTINPNIIVVVDCAQGVLHTKTDVQEWGADFIVFSAHKMFGPTGVGILWGKTNLLEQLEPLLLGGGMNSAINPTDLTYHKKSIPARFEGGTPNASGIFGFGAALDFIQKIGLDNIISYAESLKAYAVRQFDQHLSDKVIIYNKTTPTPILVFNIKEVFAQDVATHLGTIDHITVRSGDHCARLIGGVINEKNTVRISFTIYNDKNDIDKLVQAIKNETTFLGRL
ncbi:aminotransferase class V-fold PLP-dependent enzyme [Spiroplasma chrysopicola]|uniref:Cysteine desulfurase n=1 Tax=Spiroplasma chrysopicola DF-1 TaxID=1276227 RepID=R4U4P2_9MOLU|nr:aminotransferase class V-fold PLP-dependent enzyme [Spiroplasma chrysopicola]AGM25533.1 cysteine desulfurase [Spiroplasma chrysopicola DF-1]